MAAVIEMYIKCTCDDAAAGNLTSSDWPTYRY